MKQIIVIRKDLNMRKGKCVAQGSHASVKATLDNLNSKDTKEWLEEGMTKICVSVNSEKELLDIYNKAKAAKLPVALIRDAGKTEFDGVPTLTCLAIGPASESRIDAITGGLPLL